MADVEKEMPALSVVGPSQKVTMEREGCENDEDAEFEGLGFWLLKLKDEIELVNLLQLGLTARVGEIFYLEGGPPND